MKASSSDGRLGGMPTAGPPVCQVAGAPGEAVVQGGYTVKPSFEPTSAGVRTAPSSGAALDGDPVAEPIERSARVDRAERPACQTAGFLNGPVRSATSPKKEPAVPSKAIVGEKVGMTQVWDDHNRAVAVTVVRVTPMRVVQLKTPDRDGYSALQVTYGVRKARTLSKPEAGHYAAAGDGVDPGRGLVELRV